ncbi:putative S-adenosyl-L-methionine-dependent methyltransferase [Dioscorea sansibarensis]
MALQISMNPPSSLPNQHLALHFSSPQPHLPLLPFMRRKSRPRTCLRLPCTPLRALEEPAMPPASAAAEEAGDASFSVIAALQSQHNEIVVVDTPDSRVLLLDSTHNIHSMLNKEQKWTGSYWDEFVSLPAIVPPGPIAIFGLGGGTAAQLMLQSWPALQLEGWEIDGILIDIARQYFGLSGLEKPTEAGGSLSVHIGDALSPSATVPGGFAGIIVDLFCDGKILPKLKEVSTWLDINKKLLPHGRIMVNCGGAHGDVSDGGERPTNTNVSNGSWLQNSTIKALCQAFPNELIWKRMAEQESENYLALTGPPPDLNAWSAALPSPLSSNVKHWRPCKLA